MANYDSNINDKFICTDRMWVEVHAVRDAVGDPITLAAADASEQGTVNGDGQPPGTNWTRLPHLLTFVPTEDEGTRNTRRTSGTQGQRNQTCAATGDRTARFTGSLAAEAFIWKVISRGDQYHWRVHLDDGADQVGGMDNTDNYHLFTAIINSRENETYDNDADEETQWGFTVGIQSDITPPTGAGGAAVVTPPLAGALPP